MLPDDIAARMLGNRRHLHAHPELSNHETGTQAYLRAALAAEGLADVRDAAATGLVLDVVGAAGPSNRALAIRADIDALPIAEQTGLPFASTRPGVMHACGHDAHAAMAVAAAAALHRRRAEFRGTVRFIFQPAEEAEPLGGRRIVAEGWLDNVEAAIGIHVDPYLPTGRIAVAAGPYTLACDIFDIRIVGRSAHAATPHEGVDALAIAAALVGELQRLVSREASAFEPVVLSITAFQAGSGAYNIVADHAALKGTLRTGNPDMRARTMRRIAEVATALASAHGASAETKIVAGEPAVVNDGAMARLIATAAGPAAVVAAPGWAAADDFGFYSERVPAAYFRLGVQAPDAVETFALHHPQFRIDEAALPLGAATLVAASLGFLG